MLDSWVLDWFVIANVATLACGLGGWVIGSLRR